MKIEISFKLTKLWWQKKHRAVLITAAVLVLLAIAGAAVKAITEKYSKDLTLAVVNGARIRVSDFKQYMGKQPDWYQAYVTANRSQILNDLIDRELIYQKI